MADKVIDDNSIEFFKDIFAKSLRDKNFCIRVTQSRLSESHMPRRWMSWFWKIFKEYFNNPKYGGKNPSIRVFKDKINDDSTIDDNLKKVFITKISDLYSRNVQNEEYSLEAVEKMIDMQDFKNTLKDTIVKVNQSKDPQTAIKHLLDRSFKISEQRNKIEVVDLFDEVKKRQKFREYIKKNPGKFKRFMFTSLPTIQKCLPGGLTQCSMLSITAKTGRGKSIMTISFGYDAIMQGLNVTHITSENQNFQTTGRYDSRISGFNYDDIQLDNISDSDKKNMIKMYNGITKKTKARIKIVKMNPNEFNAATIFHTLAMLESDGHKTDLLIIDGPDLMQPVANVKDKRLQAAAIYWEVSNVLQQKKCIGIVTTQLKQMSKDDNPEAEDLSESYDKARLLDMIIALTQNKTQKANNEASLVVTKNRDGSVPEEPILISTAFKKMSFEEKKVSDLDGDDNNDSEPKKKGAKFKVIDGGAGGKENDSHLDNLRKISKKDSVKFKPKKDLPVKGIRKMKKKEE